MAGDFECDVRPLLQKYCVACHSGEDANADVDFEAIKSARQIESADELWEKVVDHLEAGTMPPEEEPQPSEDERNVVESWFREFVSNIEPRPAEFRPRRLSVTEYRNTLRSVLGFDLEVDVIEAEQTITERSMVIKLLPTDPPGQSGFKNDTHNNPLTTVVWDQYSYLVDAALEELFSPQRRPELERLTESPIRGELTRQQLQKLLRRFVSLAYRRPATEEHIGKIQSRLSGLRGRSLSDALKLEMKSVLMSPRFVYRGLLIKGERGKRQPVDPFELAERLSYFFWADMPDERLMSLAADGTLAEPSVYAAEIDRMLASEKARSLAETFATEWLTLDEIEHVSNNPPQMVALKSQPIDFMHYLFTEDRPLLELIDSRMAFVSPHTSRMYGGDAKQMTKYVKQRGIEVEIVPNQRIELEQTAERGGILTMPGVLAMNRGPILRGTWVLERILGEKLPEPPANVGQVPPNRRGESLTFRQRFEQHRANSACAVCHNKIDPLGFALESYDSQGKYILAAKYQPGKKQRKAGETPDRSSIDTSGRLPSGESFDDIAGLKKILRTSRRDAVIRNIVERTMAYALCRKLEVHDRPTVEAITRNMSDNDGTWRDLFHAIAGSVSFRQTILSGD